MIRDDVKVGAVFDSHGVIYLILSCSLDRRIVETFELYPSTNADLVYYMLGTDAALEHLSLIADGS